MHTTHSIRSAYLEFFKKQNHVVVPSALLFPENDPTTLFTGSGMQPMIQYLLGSAHPLGTRIADSQKSFRAQDIEEVGDNRHTTFFEMLGNWSFGDYFKAEQIQWMFSFLTDELGLDPRRLYFTCYSGNESLGIPRDTQAAGLWQAQLKAKGIDAPIAEDAETKGMQGARIFYYGDKKNWWSRAGVPSNMPVGEPGGPDTEMFWDFGEQLQLHENSQWSAEPCHVNCDCGRFVEIGNNVFMAYRKTESGFELLPKPNVDFGGGLERLAAAVNDNPDVFTIDLFTGLRQKIEQLTNTVYGQHSEQTKAYRIVCDHLRAATFLIGDGVIPSNTDRGYVVRRLLRRAVRYADMLGVPQGVFADLAQSIITTYAEAYPNLSEKRESITEEIAREEKKFRETLQKGMKEFEKLATQNISGRDAFVLFSTYGFPLELTQELAAEKNLSVDAVEFAKEMEKHQDLSRTASAGKFKGGLADHSEKTTMLHTCTHLMLAALRKYLGNDVHQAGSNITEERTRFDFTYPKKVEPEIVRKVEEYVNEAISKKCTVSIEVMDKADAQAQGVEGSFWEKYPDKVNVYSAKAPDGTVYTRELCGGPHVTNTENIKGTFKIVKEEACSAGVRRVKGVLQ
ncbi:MAG: alanine--tRNA ligase [Candidatus Kerfeldbacteria bacterium]|nr:alanine--tRNA ligase [Candidatus Kerfeldbacteria bacterium]